MPERILYQRGDAAIGRFSVHPSETEFRREGCPNGYLMVFPRPTIRIRRNGHGWVVADRTMVMFYNAHESYERRLIDPSGDDCVLFAAPKEWIVESVARFDPAARDNAETPFLLTHGPTDPSLHLLHRHMVRALEANPDGPPDPAALEEAVLLGFDRAIGNAYRARGVRAGRFGPGAERSRLALAEDAKRLLGLRFTENDRLDDIADQLDVSPFHLCRVFRERTGRTLTAYRNELRLHEAVHRLPDCRGRLTSLALALGFSSHSHFTRIFRQYFGVAPASVFCKDIPSRLRAT